VNLSVGIVTMWVKTRSRKERRDSEEGGD